MNQQVEPGDLDELAMSGLFDARWYLSRNEDIRDAGVYPLRHFCLYGWREGRQPNQYFDPAWYLDHNPDVQGAGMNPLLHYMRYGDQEGRAPGAHFNPAWYRTVYHLPNDAVTLAHFLTLRSTGCFLPKPEFYAVLHAAPYRDDPDAGEDPFGHYLSDMLRELREPLPDLPVVLDAGLVDQNYYLINGADVHEAGLDPVDHFCRYGWRDGRKPNIYFDTRWYLQTNPEVARMQINPLAHYILEGEAAGRRPVPYFDALWYRATYGIAGGDSALAHFLTHRRSQGFSPTPQFDVKWYVAQHSEELGTNRDPFAHYLQAGTFRDIDPSAQFSAARYRRRFLGRPSRHFRHLMHPDKDNPLVHFLRTQYR